MVATITLIILAVIIFLAAFITKRRFGILSFALAAGSLLSANWAGTLTPFLEGRGVTVVTPPLSSLVQIGLILLPPVLLLFGGPVYNKIFARVFGSAAFALLAITFFTDILANILVVSAPGSTVLQFLHYNQSTIITVGLILAVFDMLLANKPSLRRGRKSEH